VALEHSGERSGPATFRKAARARTADRQTLIFDWMILKEITMKSARGQSSRAARGPGYFEG
jgi:hypothetical protein